MVRKNEEGPRGDSRLDGEPITSRIHRWALAFQTMGFTGRPIVVLNLALNCLHFINRREEPCGRTIVMIIDARQSWTVGTALISN